MCASASRAGASVLQDGLVLTHVTTGCRCKPLCHYAGRRMRGANPATFFPRCYDLGDACGRRAFAAAFRSAAAASLLRRLLADGCFSPTGSILSCVRHCRVLAAPGDVPLSCVSSTTRYSPLASWKVGPSTHTRLQWALPPGTPFRRCLFHSSAGAQQCLDGCNAMCACRRAHREPRAAGAGGAGPLRPCADAAHGPRCLGPHPGGALLRQRRTACKLRQLCSSWQTFFNSCQSQQQSSGRGQHARAS